MKIAIVTYCDQAYKEIGDISIPNKKAYAQKHSYDFRLETNPLDPNKPMVWNKLLILMHMIEMKQWDWIFWNDSDALIANYNIKLEEIIAEASAHDLIITKDKNGINAGSFLIRCCDWSMRFLQEADSRTEFFAHQWKDQESMRNVLFNANHESHVYYIDKRKINSYVNEDLDYEPGDFVVHFPGTGGVGDRTNLARLMRKYEADIHVKIGGKEECTIIGHLGLGDLILLCPIAIYLLRDYERVYFPTSKHYSDSVRSFFLFHPRVKVFECDSYPEPYRNCAIHGDVFRTGFYGYDRPVTLPIDNNISFAENFYKQVGLDYSIRWDYSPIPELARRLYNAKLSNPNTKYSFVHEDLGRGFRINPIHLKMYNVIKPDQPQGSILGYLPFINNAWQIHAIDGPVRHLIESIDINPAIQLYYHRYARPVRNNLYGNGRWNDIDEPTRKKWIVVK